MSTTTTILVAFGIYLAAMIAIGMVFYKKTKSSEDYFLGGRNLGGWVAALSAQASDMSGWLLMGLPGAIYAAGTGQIWIAVGLFIGTVLNWILVSARIRRYTIVAGNALTLPQFFENRYGDKSGILKVVSSIFITIFFLAYTASAFSAGAKLFSIVFNIDYVIALTIGAVVILVYTFLGGFLAVCWTDFIQGLLMILTLMIVCVFAVTFLGGDGNGISATLNELGANFLNPFYENGGKVSTISIISQLAWGLGYFGMPHILVRFMSVCDEKEMKKSRVIGISWVVISLVTSCAIGVIGKIYFLDNPISNPENVFIEMINNIFSNRLALPFVAGIMLCGVLSAIMSTADSQLLVTASSVTEDIYKGAINKKASDATLLLVSRIVVIAVSIIAFFIAYNPQSSIMGLVSIAWAGLGATFGPVVLLSLFWKRANLHGAVWGMAIGGITVLVWEFLPIGAEKTLNSVTGLYSLVPAFALSIAAIVVVSLLTKKPTEEMLADFEKVNNYSK